MTCFFAYIHFDIIFRSLIQLLESMCMLSSFVKSQDWSNDSQFDATGSASQVMRTGWSALTQCRNCAGNATKASTLICWLFLLPSLEHHFTNTFHLYAVVICYLTPSKKYQLYRRNYAVHVHFNYKYEEILRYGHKQD